MMCIVLSNGRSGYTVFLEVELSPLTADVEQNRITNVHCQAIPVLSVSVCVCMCVCVCVSLSRE